MELIIADHHKDGQIINDRRKYPLSYSRSFNNFNHNQIDFIS